MLPPIGLTIVIISIIFPTNGPVLTRELGRRLHKRGVVGIPITPQPFIKLFYKPETKGPKWDPIKGCSPTDSFSQEHVPRDPLNHRLTGVGVLIDGIYILAPEPTISVATQGYIECQAEKMNRFELPMQVSAQDPAEQYTSGQSNFLRKMGANLGNTQLGLYRLFVNGFPKDPRDWSLARPTLETNSSEYGGKDCRIYGFGAALTKRTTGARQIGKRRKKVRGRRPGAKIPPLERAGIYENFNATDRVYSWAEIDQVKPVFCDNTTRLCRLALKPGYLFCPSAGAGSPVFCGSNPPKLTYMIKWDDNANGPCRQSAMGYHIPSLSRSIELKIEKLKENFAADPFKRRARVRAQ